MSRDYALHPFRQPIHLQIDYQKELNEQQQAAVMALPGPALVIAGAGSGKTRTLIYRVAYLLEQGIPPDRILLLTFTNKAAREMMRRVTDLLGQELEQLWGGTFHSIGNRVLRRHAEAMGYRRDFSILDREDARHLLAACLAESGFESTERRMPKPEVLAEIFSLAVNTERSIEQILAQDYDRFHALAEVVTELQKQYAERKRRTNSMDFDDLLVLWLRLLREHSDILETYQRRFQFILVDEYQDTNRLQGDLIDLLGARHKNVMVVGDDAQSIYAWRGANYENILKFPDRYPGAKVYKIETNYRSTPQILQLANEAIRANIRQFPKELAPARKAGMRPALVVAQDAGQQAAFVAQRVLELREEGVDLNDMAVLYRSHFHALELQLELTRRNIPFSITSGIRFFEQAHIKDVAAYLKLTANPVDELSFKRIGQLLPGIGGKGADKLWAQYHVALVEKSRGSVTGLVMPEALQACADRVPKKAAAGWAQWVATMAQLASDPVRGNASEMIRLVLEAGYEEFLTENYANHNTRLEDLQQMAAFARQFPNVDDFLSQLALYTNVEAEVEGAADRDEEQLRLSTIHQAKGLEFDVVFVIMLCDGMFPSERSLETTDGVEEERRLLYVSITRARNELYLSYPLTRGGPGGDRNIIQRPSRFLSELPPELLEEWNLRPYG